MGHTIRDRHNDLRAHADSHNLELRIDRDEDAPAPWAVWGWNPTTEREEDAEIIGCGETESEAVENARAQLRRWESK